MRINRNLVLGFVVFTGLGTAIFFLPKAVVNNKKMANRDSTAEAPKMAETEADHGLDSTMLASIDELRNKISATKVEKEKSKAYSRLADTFLKANRFDSAGSYYEKASELTADPKLVY
jgi:hypothetical protein